MMEKPVDIIVLGATGFTGKCVVKTLAALNKEVEYSDIKWGISGRSREKLNNLLSEMEEIGVNVTKMLVIECDIKDEGSVTKVSGQARVLINCTGPNTLLCEPVIRACIATKTNYVDISAEFYHILCMYEAHNKAAQDNNVLIVPACGFDSTAVLSGLIYLEKHFNGTLHSVEGYLELGIPRQALIPGCGKCLLHYGTWESLLHEMFNHRKLTEKRKQILPNALALADEVKRGFFHRRNRKFWIPYPLLDQDMAEMTQLQLQDMTGKHPYHCKIYMTMPLLIHFFIIIPAFFIAFYLCYSKWFQKSLLRYPRLFTLGYISHKGPSEKMRNETKYSFTLNGKGWEGDMNVKPSKTMSVKVSGSDPAYKTTAAAIAFSAITILKERAKMPKGGGLLTGGTAFCNTGLVDRLSKNYVNYEIVSCDK